MQAVEGALQAAAPRPRALPPAPYDSWPAIDSHAVSVSLDTTVDAQFGLPFCCQGNTPARTVWRLCLLWRCAAVVHWHIKAGGGGVASLAAHLKELQDGIGAFHAADVLSAGDTETLIAVAHTGDVVLRLRQAREDGNWTVVEEVRCGRGVGPSRPLLSPCCACAVAVVASGG